MIWNNIPDDIDKYYGFVYIICNNYDGKFYIGEKAFWKTVKRPPLKGRKNKRHFKKPSDWETYTGSSNELNADIKKHGINHFQKFILYPARTVTDMHYVEQKFIIDSNALVKEYYYNSFLGGRINSKGISEWLRDDLLHENSRINNVRWN